MRFCLTCLGLGYCRRLKAFVVTDKELTPAFEKDARDFCATLGISPAHWPDFLVDALANYPGRIVGRMTDQEVHLNTELLYAPANAKDDDLDPDTDYRPPEYRSWYRDTLCRPAPERPRTRNRARLRSALTIVRALYPEAASQWGVRPANDP